MKIYTDKDFCKEPTQEVLDEYKRVKEREKIGVSLKCARSNLYREYPEAVRHYQSLFPNNHIELFDWKNSGKMDDLINEFEALVHNEDTIEQNILHFINHRPAHFIIGSLLSYKDFGHHEAYIFPEFRIANGKYRADYLVIGKNSGGYEFLFIELEAPNSRTTLKSGYSGQATRSGVNQIYDWQREIVAKYNSFTSELKKMSNKPDSLPVEFIECDPTRLHYMVISGTRDDYNDVTYRQRRTKNKESGIGMYHYDNLIDLSRNLKNKDTF